MKIRFQGVCQNRVRGVCAFHRNHNTLRKLHRARRTETTRARSHSFHGQPALHICSREQKTQKSTRWWDHFPAAANKLKRPRTNTARAANKNSIFDPLQPLNVYACWRKERCVINAAAPAMHQTFIFHPQAQAGNVRCREWWKGCQMRAEIGPTHFFVIFKMEKAILSRCA